MKTWISIIVGLATMALLPNLSLADESTVYQVYRPVDLGVSEEPPPKDIFISLGDGVKNAKKGSRLDAYRRVASFDSLTQRHMGDHMIPVAKLKVIYVDDKTAIARVEQFVSMAQEPALYPQAIMVGDVIQSAP